MKANFPIVVAILVKAGRMMGTGTLVEHTMRKRRMNVIAMLVELIGTQMMRKIMPMTVTEDNIQPNHQRFRSGNNY